MVHALDAIPRLLRPRGVLIDIHPVREAPRIEVHDAGKIELAEPYASYDYDEDLRHADDALASAIARGRFRLDGSRAFELITYGGSVSEMREHFVETGAYDASVPDEAAVIRQAAQDAKVEEVMRSGGSRVEVALREPARVMRLLPSEPQGT